MFQNTRITKGSRNTPAWLVVAAGYWLVLESEAAVANGCMCSHHRSNSSARPRQIGLLGANSNHATMTARNIQ